VRLQSRQQEYLQSIIAARHYFLELVSKNRFVSGHDFSRAEKRAKAAGFNPCGNEAKTHWIIFETSSSLLHSRTSIL
jgi:hypothetical protein